MCEQTEDTDAPHRSDKARKCKRDSAEESRGYVLYREDLKPLFKFMRAQKHLRVSGQSTNMRCSPPLPPQLCLCVPVSEALTRPAASSLCSLPSPLPSLSALKPSPPQMRVPKHPLHRPSAVTKHPASP
eukprot:6193886-Pleurochrysis_carterae.AAC.1